MSRSRRSLLILFAATHVTTWMAVESPFSWPSVLESGLVFTLLCRSRCGLSITFVLKLNIRPSPLFSAFLPIMLTLGGGEKAGIGILRRCRRPAAKKGGGVN